MSRIKRGNYCCVNEDDTIFDDISISYNRIEFIYLKSEKPEVAFKKCQKLIEMVGFRNSLKNQFNSYFLYIFAMYLEKNKLRWNFALHTR